MDRTVKCIFAALASVVAWAWCCALFHSFLPDAFFIKTWYGVSLVITEAIIGVAIFLGWAFYSSVEPHKVGELKSCPFCGFHPDIDDPDCIYPVDRQKTFWALQCYETGGGCTAKVLGCSCEEVIEKWNRRKNA